MKKTLILVFATATFIACNEAGRDTAGDDYRDTTSISSPSGLDNPADENLDNAYTPRDGDVSYRDDKVVVMRNGEWVTADDEVTLDNGAVVYPDGRVKKEDKEIRLDDGETVDKTGNFFDRTGKAIEKGWNDTKEAAKEMGRDVEKAAEKTGDKVEGALDKDKDHDEHR